MLAGLCLVACDPGSVELSDTDNGASDGVIATDDDSTLADAPLDGDLVAPGGDQQGPEPGPAPSEPPVLVVADGIVGVAIANSTDKAYAWTRANTVSAGIPEQLTSYRSPYRWTGASGSSVVDTAISSNDRSYVWLANGTAGRGSTGNPTSLATWTYHLPGGRQPSDLVGIAIRKSNDQTHAYYDDGTYSRGNTSWLGSIACCSSYTMPPGRQPSDIVGMDFDPQGRLHTWYDDDTYSIGTAWDLDWYQEPRRYARHGILASKWPADAPPVAAPAPSWPPTVDVEPYDGPKVLAPPAETFDLPGLGANDDLLVAAGRDSVGVALMADVYFYDKSGNPLTGGGLSSSGRLPLSAMFAEFVRKGPLRAGQEPSPLDVNQFMGFEESCDDPSYPETDGYSYCVSSAPYDTRVHYDPKGDRFVILANLRNRVWTNYFKNEYYHPELSEAELLALEYSEDFDTCGYFATPQGVAEALPNPEHCKLARRLRAVAVSRTSDPRDGFYTYVFVENNYRDWPWMAVDGDWAILSAQGVEHPGAAASTLLSLADLRKGKVRPQYLNFYANELAGRIRVEPPQQVDTLPGYSLVTEVSGEEWWFFTLPHPTTPYAKQSPGVLNVSLDGVSNFSRERAVYRHGALHLTRPVETEITEEIRKSEVHHVKLPLWLSGKQPYVSTQASQGFKKWIHVSADPNTLRLDEPVLAVNGADETLIAWGHSGVYAADAEPPRVEHTLWRNGASFLDWRRTFRAGDGYASGYPAAKIKAIGASVDPVDERTFWVAHKYGMANGGWGIVIGSVDPTQ